MPHASEGRRGVRSVVIVVMVAVGALVGGIAARGVYQRQPTAQPPVVAPETTSQGPQPSAEPGSPTVRLTADAAEHPDRRAVRRLLQRYFDAINSKNYDEWAKVVTKSRLRTTSRSEWSSDYRTTRDGSVVVYRIEESGIGQLIVLLRFVSVQALSDAPPDFPHGCIRWHVVFPLAVEDGQWRLDAGETGATPRHQLC